MTRALTLPNLSLMLAASALTWCAGCSLRYDFSESECTVDADCARFEDGSTFFLCQEELCKVAQGVECRTAADCTGSSSICNAALRCASPTTDDMGPSEDMTPDLDMPDEDASPDDMPDDMPIDMPSGMACDTNSACIAALGETFICGGNGVCVNALDEAGNCQSIYYSRTSSKDDVVFIGSLLPLVEPYGSVIGRPLEQSIQFAVDTINDDGGLAGGRKIAWVSCDSKGNPEVAQRAATHLAQVVGTPAIVGPLFSETFISTTSNVTNREGVFAITPTGTSPSIRNQRQGKNLVWRNIASDEFQAYAISERVKSLGPSKVLVLYKGDKYGTDLQDLIFNDLKTEFTTDELKVVRLPNPIDVADPSNEGITAAYAMQIGQVVQKDIFEPQLVVIIGTNEGALTLSAFLGTAQAQNIVLPSRFLLSHGVVAAMSDIGTQLDASGLETLIPRIEGVSPEIIDLNDVAYQEYLRKYSMAFNNDQPALASTTTFDAVMTIAFSMATLDATEEITGQKIADGVQKLVDVQNGTPIQFFDTSFFSAGVTALQMGQTIDMTGVSGTLDYDLTNGEVYTPVVGWKIVKDMNDVYTIARSREMTFPDAPALTNATWVEAP